MTESEALHEAMGGDVPREVSLMLRIDSINPEQQGPGHHAKSDGFSIKFRLAETEEHFDDDDLCIFNSMWVAKSLLDDQGADVVLRVLLDQSRQELVQFPREIAAIERKIQDATDVLRGTAFVNKRADAG